MPPYSEDFRVDISVYWRMEDKDDLQLKLTQIKVYDDIVQVSSVNFKSSTPFYETSEALKAISIIMDFKGCNDEFDTHVSEKCISYIKETIIMSEKDMPKTLSSNPDEFKIHRERTLVQLKKCSTDSILLFKKAYKIFCRSETGKQ